MPCIEKQINKCTKCSHFVHTKWSPFPLNCSSSTQLMKLLFDKLFRQKLRLFLIPITSASRCFSFSHTTHLFNQQVLLALLSKDILSSSPGSTTTSVLGLVVILTCPYSCSSSFTYLPTSLVAPYSQSNKQNDLKNISFPYIRPSKAPNCN